MMPLYALLLPSLKPLRFPKGLKGWHGKPATRQSISSASISLALLFETSPNNCLGEWLASMNALANGSVSELNTCSREMLPSL
eukprot:8599326-Pyramimonas_sp.AAC.1